MMHRPCPETQTSAGDLRNQNTTTVLPVVYLPASMTSTWVQSKKKKKKKSKFPPPPPPKKNLLQGSVSSTQSAHALQFDRRSHILGTDAQSDETRANEPLWVRFTSALAQLTNRKYHMGSVTGTVRVRVRVREAACGCEGMLAPWRKPFVFVLFSRCCVFVSVFVLVT